MNIVKVTEQTIAEAGRIHATAWQSSHRAFCTPEFVAQHTPETQTEYLRREVAAGKSLYMLLDEVSVGIVTVQDSLIENLYVVPDAQRRGYGTQLLQFAMAQCVSSPQLWVLDNNIDARRLYERFGFTQTGKRNQLRPDLYEIELRVPPLQLHFGRVDDAIAIMREVAAWGRARSYRVWPEEWLTQEELLTADAQPEHFCVGTIGGELACAFILQQRDRDYWPDAPEGEALYLHKLCVRRNYAGLTRRIVEALKDECRCRGVRYIRLDTALDEKAVRKIYLNVGFHIVDILDYDNGRSMALYQLEVTP